MDYVTDTSGVPSSSGGAVFFPEDENVNGNTLIDPFSSYYGQVFLSEKPGCCIHNTSAESNLMACSSLPSVTGEYLTECNGDKSKQDVVYKMLSRSTCPGCKKQFVIKHRFDEFKRSSLGRLPNANGEGRPILVKNTRINQSTSTISLDSGYSPDLAVSI